MWMFSASLLRRASSSTGGSGRIFRDFVVEVDFETGPPGEESFTRFFNFLRLEKKYASTTLWTYYSCLNSMMKRKYNIKLQELPRLTMLLKGFDTDIKNKAPIFEETQLNAFMLGNMESSYWLVRQAISIVSDSAFRSAKTSCWKG